MRAKGSNAVLVYDVETVYGADPGTVNGRKVYFVTEGLSGGQALEEDPTLSGARTQRMPLPGVKDAGGPINVKLSETAHATFLKHLFGSNTTTGAGDPYTHTCKVGALPVGMVLEKGFPDLTTPQYFKYNGVRISKGSFKFAVSGIAEMSLEFKAKKETVSGTAYDATVTAESYVPFSGVQITMQEGGAGITTVNEVEFSVDNQLDADGYVLDGTGERGDLPEGMAVVTGRLKAFFDSIALYNKAVNSTETSLVITLDKGLTPARQIVFTLPELKYERVAPKVDGPKGVYVELPFKAYYDNAAEATSIQCVIKNGLATI